MRLSTTIGLIALTGAAAAAAAQGPAPMAAVGPVVDRSILHQQVILAKLGFSSGVLDGTNSAAFRHALSGFQQARGLPRTGQSDPATLRALHQYRAWRPTKTIALTPAMLAGPYKPDLPRDPEAQSKLDHLSYRSPMEKLAEMFHTTPAVLMALNSPDTMLRAGTPVVFPNALPTSRDYRTDNDDWREKLAMLNVDANVPEADHIVVTKSDGLLRVLDKDDRLVAQFPATLGSARDPLPLGNWTIRGVAPRPDWRFDPKLIANTRPGAQVAIVPPGPNNPVGVVWIDISKPHYGIHGTSEPANIGKTESNGCIRLTNWDAARLSQMVKPGMRAVFRV